MTSIGSQSFSSASFQTQLPFRREQMADRNQATTPLMQPSQPSTPRFGFYNGAPDRLSPQRTPEPTAQKKPMLQLALKGDSCIACLGLESGMIQQDKLEAVKSKLYQEIMSHEQAHASAAGAFGGSIHIEYDSNGIPVGGHVPITMPGLDPQNPEESLKAFQTIINAALAPSDPSGQDLSVAAAAQASYGKALMMMQNKQEKREK